MSNLVDRSIRTQFYNLFKMKPSNEEDKKDQKSNSEEISESDMTSF